MKKALSFIIALLILIPNGAAAYAAPAATIISDADGLLAIREDPAGSYALGADIDMAGID